MKRTVYVVSHWTWDRPTYVYGVYATPEQAGQVVRDLLGKPGSEAWYSGFEVQVESPVVG